MVDRERPKPVTHKLEGTFNPPTWKNIVGAGAIALGRIAVALERIAAAQERDRYDA